MEVMSSTDCLAALNNLDDPNHIRRSEAIEQLRAAVRDNGGRVLQDNLKRLFVLIKDRLTDNNWYVVHQCIQLVAELLPEFGGDLDGLIPQILVPLAACLGDTKVVIRKDTVQTLTLCLKHTQLTGEVLRVLFDHGLSSDNWKIRQGSTAAAASLLLMVSKSYQSTDAFRSVVGSIVDRLVDSSEPVKLAAEQALTSLYEHCDLDKIVSTFTEERKQNYRTFVETVVMPAQKEGKLSRANNENIAHNGNNDSGSGKGKGFSSGSGWSSTANNNVEFGFVPTRLLHQLRDSTDWKTRAVAIEELHIIVTKLKSIDVVVPHLRAMIAFLSSLLDDQNFKISLTTLQIFGLLIDKVGGDAIAPHLNNMVPYLTEKFGDNKIVIRQANTKVMMKLMHSLSPEAILSSLVSNMDHHNWHVREEIVNCVAQALLTFDVNSFNFKVLIPALCTGLSDSKQKVKSVTLDAFAIVYNLIGKDVFNHLPAKIDSGIKSLLEERFSKKHLPSLSAEGLIEHKNPQDDSNAIMGDGDEFKPRRQLSAGVIRKIPWDVPTPGTSGRSRSGARRSAHSDSAVSNRMSSENWLEEFRLFDDSKPATTGNMNTSSGLGPTNNGGSYARMYQRRKEMQNQGAGAGSAPGDGGGEGMPLQLDVRDFKLLDKNSWLSDDLWDMSTPVSMGLDGVNPMSDFNSPIDPNDNYYPSFNTSRKTPRTTRPKVRTSGGSGGHGSPYKGDGIFSPKKHLRLPKSSPAKKAQKDDLWSGLDSLPPSSAITAPGGTGLGSTDKINLWLPQPSEPNTPQESPRHAQDFLDSSRSHRQSWPEAPSADRTRTPSPNDDLVLLGTTTVDSGVSSPGAFSMSPPQMRSSEGTPVPDLDERAVSIGSVSSSGAAPVRTSAASTKILSFDDIPVNTSTDGKPKVDYNKVTEQLGILKQRQQVRPRPPASQQAKPVPTGEQLGADFVLKGSNLDTDTDAEALLGDVSGAKTPQPGRQGLPNAAMRRRQEQQGTDETPDGHLNLLKKRLPSSRNGGQTGTRKSMESFSTNDDEPQPLARQRSEPTRGVGQHRTVVDSASKPVEVPTSENLQPVQNPEKALKQAFNGLQSSEWMEHFEGITTMRRLVLFNDSVLVPQLHRVTLEMLAGVDNLRSALSKNALICLSDMFSTLGRSMDAELDNLVPALLKKIAETNQFIGDEAYRTVDTMVRCVTDTRALGALLGCANHKNSAVRAKVALFLDKIVSDMSSKALSCRETEKLVHVLGTFLNEGSNETRQYAKKMIYNLYTVDSNLMTSKAKGFLSESAYKQVKEVIEAGRQKGGFEVKEVAGSARRQAGKGHVRANSGAGAAEGLVVGGKGAGPAKNAGGAGKGNPAFEALPAIYGMMSSNDFRERIEGTEKMMALIEANPKAIVPKLPAIFDYINQRLTDVNSKVNVQSLQMVQRAVVVLKDNLEGVLATLLPSLATNLASNNTNVRSLASSAVDSVIENMDCTTLVPYFVNIVTHGKPLAKPAMMEKIGDFVEKAYNRKPNVVTRHVVPLALRTLMETRADMKQANQRLVTRLYLCMAETLTEQATAQNLQPAAMQRLREYIQ